MQRRRARVARVVAATVVRRASTEMQRRHNEIERRRIVRINDLFVRLRRALQLPDGASKATILAHAAAVAETDRALRTCLDATAEASGGDDLAFATPWIA